MLEEIKLNELSPYLSDFNGRNVTRPTRLEVIGEPGAKGPGDRMPVEADYWVEEGLPLLGISLEAEGESAPKIEIMLGGRTAKSSNHMTHTISRARRVTRSLGAGGRESELNIEDGDGVLTVLHF